MNDGNRTNSGPEEIVNRLRNTLSTLDVPLGEAAQVLRDAADEIGRLRRCAKGEHEWDQLDRYSAKSCQVCGYYIGELDR